MKTKQETSKLILDNYADLSKAENKEFYDFLKETGQLVRFMGWKLERQKKQQGDDEK